MTVFRMFDAPPRATELFRPYLADLNVRGSTAFGMLLCTGPAGTAIVFDPETRKRENVGIAFDQFLEIADRNPRVFGEDMRLRASAELGPVSEGEVYSSRTRRTSGRRFDVADMEISSLDDHLGRIHAAVDPEDSFEAESPVVVRNPSACKAARPGASTARRRIRR